MSDFEEILLVCDPAPVAATTPACARATGAHANWPEKGRHRVCKHCGVHFRAKGKNLYCPDHLGEARAAQGGRGRRWEVHTKVTSSCAQCGKEITFFPSTNRKFCSYSCHLASGGAKRAGAASGEIRMNKYGAKKDANHKEIVGAFQKMGAAVMDLSTLGRGVPDLVVWCQSSWHLVDVKNPKTGYGRRGLNERQKEWALEWKGGPVYLISTVEQAVDLVNGRLEGLKRFPE